MKEEATCDIPRSEASLPWPSAGSHAGRPERGQPPRTLVRQGGPCMESLPPTDCCLRSARPPRRPPQAGRGHAAGRSWTAHAERRPRTAAVPCCAAPAELGVAVQTPGVPPGLGGVITSVASVDIGDRPSQDHGTLGSRTAQASDRREGTSVAKGLSHKAPAPGKAGGQLRDLRAAVWPLWGTLGAPHPKLQVSCF